MIFPFPLLNKHSPFCLYNLLDNINFLCDRPYCVLLNTIVHTLDSMFPDKLQASCGKELWLIHLMVFTLLTISQTMVVESQIFRILITTSLLRSLTTSDLPIPVSSSAIEMKRVSPSASYGETWSYCSSCLAWCSWTISQYCAAAAKSLQSCPTLCNPRDGSPPGSSVPGILLCSWDSPLSLGFSSVPGILLCPLDSPGKNTGVGCHFLLQCMKVKSESEVTQLCPTLRDPMDCSLQGSSIHGIFQARILEWGAISFSSIVLVKH